MISNDVLARHLEGEMSGVPLGNVAMGDVVRRGRRRRRIRQSVRATWVLAVASLFVMFPVPYDPNPRAIAGAFEVPSVIEVSDLELAVESTTPETSDPNIWLGWLHPRPEFDTASLGPDLTFREGSPSAEDLHDRVLSAVYLGESDGEPFYVYAVAPNLIDRIFEITSGNLSGEILGTSHTCCSGGDMDGERGLPGLSSTKSGDEEPVTTAEWLGLTPDVSVVAVLVDDQFIGWQTPVGGAVSMRLDHQSGAEVSLIAFTPDGVEALRYGPWPMADFDFLPLG